MCDTNGNHEHGNSACTCETNAASDHTHGHEHGHGHGQEHGATSAAVGVKASYGVQGMTCSHCVASVSDELGRLHGVKNVDVELVAGGVSRVTVASDAPLGPDDVAAAIDEAGYDLVDLPR